MYFKHIHSSIPFDQKFTPKEQIIEYQPKSTEIERNMENIEKIEQNNLQKAVEKMQITDNKKNQKVVESVCPRCGKRKRSCVSTSSSSNGNYQHKLKVMSKDLGQMDGEYGNEIVIEESEL